MLFGACHDSKKTYMSDCDAHMMFKKVSYGHLMDSLKYYDKKYIEVVGKYEEGKEESALFNDNLYILKPNTALWVNFSQDCPLYLSGTHKGFFQLDGGGYAHIKNKKIRIRGRLDLKNRGYQKQYKGCIDHVSFIEL
ncbi:hypothetical protein GCM10022392_07390 [Mucilaginibacter panaciglaebae]|uniref:Uncharacterized protein n=2 Tax=Mucilaginibacter panaciglaebae TaxID=502331 RepID=A0ABP7WGU7_9SPHI